MEDIFCNVQRSKELLGFKNVFKSTSDDNGSAVRFCMKLIPNLMCLSYGEDYISISFIYSVVSGILKMKFFLEFFKVWDIETKIGLCVSKVRKDPPNFHANQSSSDWGTDRHTSSHFYILV